MTFILRLGRTLPILPLLLGCGAEPRTESKDASSLADASADARWLDSSPQDGARDAIDARQKSSPNLEWTVVGELPKGRDHHATELIMRGSNKELWVSGGARDGFAEFFTEIIRARVGSTPLVWESAGELPHSITGHSQHIVGNFIFIIGGRYGVPRSEPKAYSATIDPDGNIGEFSETTPLPTAVWHHQSFVHEGAVYVVGGQTGSGTSSTPVDQVFRAPIIGGSIGPWEKQSSLPEKLSHHGLAQWGKNVYTVGGVTGAEGATASVFHATLLEGGALSPWDAVQPIPTPLITPSVSACQGQLYVIGGLALPLDFVGNVWHSPIDGETLTWSVLPESNLPEARAHVHQVPCGEGKLFSVGGRTDKNPPSYLSSKNVWAAEILE